MAAHKKMKEKHQQAIEEKNNQMQALEFTNEKHQQKILRLNKETDDRVANRYVARRSSPILLYSVSVQAPGKT